MRRALAAGLVLTLATGCLGVLAAVQTTDRDEAVLTVVVSSAEHETQEGYFTLGDSATIMVKPGSQLYRFLARHRGKTVRISLSEASRPGPARLER